MVTLEIKTIIDIEKFKEQNIILGEVYYGWFKQSKQRLRFSYKKWETR